MSRVVVVGAGLGGLAAAVRLAHAGHRVTVLEQSARVGGKLGRYARDGYGFDTGPSLLTIPSVYEELFADTGAPLREEVPLRPVDPAFRYRFADGTVLDVPDGGGPAVAAAMDAALGEGTGAQWTAFMERAGEIWEATRGPFLSSPLDGARGLLKESRRVGDLATIAPWLSLRQLGRRYLKDARLRVLLDRYATYTGSDPRRAPAALATVPYVEQTYGAWYVEGGLRVLVEAVARRAEQLGADIRTGADVAEIIVKDVPGPVGWRTQGVRLRDGSRVDADVVVSNADAAHTYHELLAGPPGELGRRRLRKADPSLSGFVLLLALRGRTPGLQHHTVLFPDDYDDEFDSVFGTGRHRGRTRPAPDPTVYVSAPDDPALRPDDGTEAWFVLVNAPRHRPGEPSRGVDWHTEGLAEAYADRVLEVMAERGLDVRDRVLWRVVSTPADLEYETRSVGGSIYGSSSNGARSAFLRPANASNVEGLFLVGGSSHPGGGIPLVGMSAAIVADLVGPARAGAPGTADVPDGDAPDT
ncbi:phytoene desaturase family protein [Aquipuribacter hungaricus]|uniref:Phytoene desaturase family protein n=1 Tax=Aquipuribacter hungaricus TaxID=545624 RepID=A0ABV7WGQ6_9MICO